MDDREPLVSGVDENSHQNGNDELYHTTCTHNLDQAEAETSVHTSEPCDEHRSFVNQSFSINADHSDSELDRSCAHIQSDLDYYEDPPPYEVDQEPVDTVDEEIARGAAPQTADNDSQYDTDEHTTPPDADKVDWFCCFHIYRHSLDVITLVVYVVLFVVCAGQAVVVWLDNKRSHGWCVLNTVFHPGGTVDLQECEPYAYLALYSTVSSASVAVLCVCITWALQLFANTRWLLVECVLDVLAMALAVTAFVWKTLSFSEWCHHIHNALHTMLSHDLHSPMRNTTGESNSISSCYNCAVIFDDKYPQFVHMASTFNLTVAIMAILAAHIALCLVALVVTIKRIHVAKKQVTQNKFSGQRTVQHVHGD